MAKRRDDYLAQIELTREIDENLFAELAEPAVQKKEHMVYNQIYISFVDPIRGDRLGQVLLGDGGDGSLIELREFHNHQNDGRGWVLFSGHINVPAISSKEFPNHLDWVAAKEAAIVQAIKERLSELVKAWKNQTVDYFEDLVKTMPPWNDDEVANFAITAQDINALGGDTRHLNGTFAEADEVASEMWRNLQNNGQCIASVVVSDGTISCAR